MLHRIRLAVQSNSFVKLGGVGTEVEVDETFIGGAARFMHPARRRRMITATGVKDKSAALGIFGRGGKVCAYSPYRTDKRRRCKVQSLRTLKRAPSINTGYGVMSYIGQREFRAQRH